MRTIIPCVLYFSYISRFLFSIFVVLFSNVANSDTYVALSNDLNNQLERQLGYFNESSSSVLRGRETMSLNGQWKFQLDPVGGAEVDNRGVLRPFQTVDPDRVTPGEIQGYHLQEFNDQGWDEIDVPGSWNVYDEYSEYFDNAWYRTEFELAPQPGKKVRLHFDAVYYQAEVWLNGVKLGFHIGGATPFDFDISELLNASGNNVIALRANNLFRQGAWWPWGGISRDVKVLIDPEVFIDAQKIVATPDLETGFANVQVEAIVVNDSTEDKNVSLRGYLKDGAGEIISDLNSSSDDVLVSAGDQVSIMLSTDLNPEQYELWHFDNPALYYSNVVLQVQNDIGERYVKQDRFGLRKIEFTDGIFKLNGEQVRLLGFNRISDDRVNGSVEPLYLVRRDLDRMKAAGTNLTRMMHEVLAKEVIEYADEIGILLIEEVPVWGVNADLTENNTQAPEQLKDMINRDINHPSIIAWSVANEIVNTTDVARSFVSRMVNLSKQLDPTRPVTYARLSAGGVSANDAIQFTDFPSVNLYGGFGSTQSFINIWPDKPVFVSEFSRDGFSFPTSRETLEHTTGNGSQVHVWDASPKVMGASVWSYNDYRSEFRGTSINQTRGWGIQDNWGNLKVAYKQAQDGFAPVSDLTVNASNTDSIQRESFVTLNPRGLPEESIPSFKLSGYKLLWQALGQNDQVLAGQLLDLPDILPGSNELNWRVNWSSAELTGSVIVEKVTLLNPTGHEVKVSYSAARVAAKPQIENIIVADGAIRAVYNPVTGADEYVLEAIGGGRKFTASAKKSGYIDLAGLTNDVEYVIKVFAVNRHGAIPSIAKLATPSNVGSLPPKIQAITALENGFVLGFIKAPGENSEWEIEVVDALSNSLVESYTTTTIGASRRETLLANRDYRVRIRNTDNGVWSEYIAVKTLGQDYRPALTTYGSVAGRNSIAVRIEPHPRAHGYEIVAKPIGGGDKIKKRISSAAVDTLVINGLSEDTEYQVHVKVMTAFGMSRPAIVEAFTAAPQFIAFEPVTIVVATDSPDYVESAGNWFNSSLGGRFSQSPNAVTEWQADLPQGGNYTVEAFIPGQSSATRNAAYSVEHSNGESLVVIDQQTQNGGWIALGTYNFTASERAVVQLTAPSGIIRADRVRWRELGGQVIAPSENTPAEFVFDTTSPGYSEPAGDWQNSSVSGRFTRSANAVALWNIGIPESGDFRVEKFVDRTTISSRQAQFTFEHDGGSDTVIYDQLDTSGAWVNFGVFSFNEGSTYNMQVTNLDGILLRSHLLRLIEDVGLDVTDVLAYILDWNADGTLDENDVLGVQAAFQSGEFIDPVFDLNMDNIVDEKDIALLELQL